MSRYIHTIKKNTQALLVASKAVDIEVNAEKTKYICMYCEQNAVQNCNITTERERERERERQRERESEGVSE